MSIEPNVEAWKKRFVFSLLFTVGVLLLTGAKEINHELRGRPAQLKQARHTMHQWSCSLAADLPDEREAAWTRIATTNPQLLIRICSQPAQTQPPSTRRQ